MLADDAGTSNQFGNFGSGIQKPGTFRYELLDFIANELPRWRDSPDRRGDTSEPVLNAQLCAHLNGAAHRSEGWDLLQFRNEEPDERDRRRKIDLVPAPCGTAIFIEGRRHTEYDSIMPIECKRLPTPRAADRDDREYVISRFSTTGGIQRFKEGYHGSAHTLGAMIGYVQEETTAVWETRIAGWINDLVSANKPGWTIADHLHPVNTDTSHKLAVLHSSHARRNLPDIDLRHFWIVMN